MAGKTRTRRSKIQIENGSQSIINTIYTIKFQWNILDHLNRKLFQLFHKYIRREPKPGGGYRYIYKESGAGGASKQPAEKVPEKRSKASASEKTGPVPAKSPAARLRAKYLGEMRPLLKKKVTQTIEGGKNIQIGFTTRGNKHLYTDTFTKARGRLKKKI